MNENNQQNNQPNSQPKSYSAYAIVSLITGILSIFFMCCCTYLGIILGILAVTMALIHKGKTGVLSGMCIAGIICGVLGFAASVASIVLLFVGGQNSLYNQLQDMYNQILSGTYY